MSQTYNLTDYTPSSSPSNSPKLTAVVKKEPVDEEPMSSLDPSEGLEIIENEEKEAKEAKKDTKKKVQIRKSTATQEKKRGGAQKTTKVKANATAHVSEAVASQIGKIKALPNDIDGCEVNYLPASAGAAASPRAVKMDTIPTDSFVVISNWRKVNSQFGDSYILYIKDDNTKTYWSNSRVSGIIGAGLVNPETQFLTISRLADGSFIYGYVNKK